MRRAGVIVFSRIQKRVFFDESERWLCTKQLQTSCQYKQYLINLIFIKVNGSRPDEYKPDYYAQWWLSAVNHALIKWSYQDWKTEACQPWLFFAELDIVPLFCTFEAKSQDWSISVLRHVRLHKIGQFVPIYQRDYWLNEEHTKTYSCMRYNKHTLTTTSRKTLK